MSYNEEASPSYIAHPVGETYKLLMLCAFNENIASTNAIRINDFFIVIPLININVDVLKYATKIMK